MIETFKYGENIKPPKNNQRGVPCYWLSLMPFENFINLGKVGKQKISLNLVQIQIIHRS